MNSEIIKQLIAIYGSTTVTSLLFNKHYFRKRNKIAFDKSKRNLKYRDLSLESTLMLDNVRSVYKLADKVSIFLSAVPVIQVFYTISNIMATDDKFSNYFDDKIAEINQAEISIRKDYLEQIRRSRIIPENIKSKLEDEDYLPNEEEYDEVMVANASRIITEKVLKLVKNDDKK